MAKHGKGKTSEFVKKEKHWLRQWNPEIALVAAAGVVVIIGLAVFSSVLLNDLKSSLDVANAKLSGAQSNALYNIPSNASTCVFTCEVNSKLSLQIEPTGAASCATAGKVNLLAFHSPTCLYCEAQTPILDQLKQKYGDRLDIQYACAEIHEQDPALCQANADGKYLPYAQSQALVTQYQSAVQGTPTLIFNCEYARVGSYSIMDQQKGTTTELTDIDTIISTLLGS
jgi:thiol-disulfide isomerase/thioredoxin